MAKFTIIKGWYFLFGLLMWSMSQSVEKASKDQEISSLIEEASIEPEGIAS